jgi:hypothetical protein
MWDEQISEGGRRSVKSVKDAFEFLLNEQSKGSTISYFDFLIVAKKLSFRFEESSHLMALKKFFNKYSNYVPIKKLTDSLCISKQSLIHTDGRM